EKKPPDKTPDPPSKEVLAKAIQDVERLKGKIHYDEKNDHTVDRIDFHDVPVKDDDLTFLKAFVNLRELELVNTQVTGPGLKHLEGLPKLQRVVLIGSPVGDGALAYLRSLPKLGYLSLSRTQVTDAGLVHLDGMSQLRVLFLSSTAASDK